MVDLRIKAYFYFKMLFNFVICSQMLSLEACKCICFLFDTYGRLMEAYKKSRKCESDYLIIVVDF